MKLQQGQVWKKDDQYFRLVHVERLAVEYKAMKDIFSRHGHHCKTTKKIFCRLIKDATLLAPDES